MTTNQARSSQSGIALVTVMVILLLSIIAVLAAGRTGLLNEALVGSAPLSRKIARIDLNN